MSGPAPIALDALAAGIAAGAADARLISGITADSRAVKPGFVFAALKGDKADGAAFAGAAAKAGAAAILAAEDAVIDAPGVPVLRAADPRLALALMAARLYPLQPEVLVAVTGTSGKTSVAYFTRQIFAAAGFKAAAIGTLGVVTDAGIEKGSLTTPDPVELHRTLDRLAREGFTHVALEASSHGLDQRRLDGLRLTAAGFTNLGRDHLDYHPSVEAYLAAKLRLLTEVLPMGASALVDADGPYTQAVADAVMKADRFLLTVGAKGEFIRADTYRNKSADFVGPPVPPDKDELEFREYEGLGPWEPPPPRDRFRQAIVLNVEGNKRFESMSLRVGGTLDLQLPGAFQVSNVAMAVGLAIGGGLPVEVALKAARQIKGAPGRLEKVVDTTAGGAIFVDYAHKPDAVTAVLDTLRPLVPTDGRLMIVIGAGGDRDKGKRPLMGAAATAGADVVIVTDDNPRSEDPATIRAAIMAAAPGAIEIPGRGEAIARAVAMMEPGDVLVVAGKGHETGQIVGGRTLPFSDHEAVASALREKAS